MTVGAVDNSFFADPASLAGVKREAGKQSPEALREVARQFESLFTTMMLKSMRQATPKDSLFGSDQQDFYQDLFDQQMAGQLSKGRGLGLADMLVRQLMQGGGEGVGAEGATPEAGTRLGTSATSAPDTASRWTPGNREEFVDAILPAAREAGRKLGVDPLNIVAHAALETGWGRSLPVDARGQPSFNLFGIKAGAGWNGDAVQSATHEFGNGRMQAVTDRFRAYDSPEQCLNDYASLLQGNPRYSAALGTGSDTAAFASALKNGGYATDPDYVAKLTRVAADLKTRLDRPITQSEA